MFHAIWQETEIDSFVCIDDYNTYIYIQYIMKMFKIEHIEILAI